MPDTIIETSTNTPKRFQCRHIFTDGHRCGSACLRNEEFCYYHHTTRRTVANPKQRRSRRATFSLPLPEDRSAVQASIGEVLQRIAANEIDPRRAGLLLYGLQIASLNLPKPKPEPIPEPVEEITTDPDLGTLAPRAEVTSAAGPSSVVADLIMKLLQDDQPATPAPETNILPTLNAHAEHCVPTHRKHAAPKTRRTSPYSQAKPNHPGTPSHRDSAPGHNRLTIRGGLKARATLAWGSAPGLSGLTIRGLKARATLPHRFPNQRTHNPPAEPSFSSQTHRANRSIHRRLLSFLHRWPPRPNQPAPPL